ncbi:tol-pal system-associated acyl-CoA thioesterase [Mitsuaria sp. WAJ17]|uniref:tol-pal system-associated acyl-CoA thioesterase n=1 Tax=Mitsuaria sp. WAJ17 TaxID=2761452 RepID=UPI0016017E65|nr:tol-pal system-associated acyl-CoA thioesterase [Mitsuaria sp. WAJ17]MBB2486405.1 tol-pal system-associated acyl-CoA thioesterase [Mitsuaria sp. WAJ17]
MSQSRAHEADYRHGLRVYWEDTDAGGVVFYANYLKFFERARTEWLRELGFSQELMRQSQGRMFVVSRTAVSYLAPARLDDWVSVTVELREQGRASMTLFQQAWRDGQLLAEGEIRIGCVDVASFRPARMPEDLLARLSTLILPSS